MKLRSSTSRSSRSISRPANIVKARNDCGTSRRREGKAEADCAEDGHEDQISTSRRTRQKAAKLEVEDVGPRTRRPPTRPPTRTGSTIATKELRTAELALKRGRRAHPKYYETYRDWLKYALMRYTAGEHVLARGAVRARRRPSSRSRTTSRRSRRPSTTTYPKQEADRGKRERRPPARRRVREASANDAQALDRARTGRQTLGKAAVPPIRPRSRPGEDATPIRWVPAAHDRPKRRSPGDRP